VPEWSEDTPLSAAELAQIAGVATNTIRNWTKLPDQPLRGTRNTGRYPTYTIAQLRAFCAAHDDRSAARKVVRNLAARAASRATEGQQPEQVRAVVLNLRVAALAALDAALSAARQAEQTAVAHREQIEALAVTIRSYDDLLTQLTAPTTLHD